MYNVLHEVSPVFHEHVVTSSYRFIAAVCTPLTKGIKVVRSRFWTGSQNSSQRLQIWNLDIVEQVEQHNSSNTC